MILSLLVLAVTSAACLARGRPRFEELEERARRFEPVPGRAVLYLIRDQTVSPTFRIGISVDGAVVGALAARSFIHCDFEPGRLLIASTESEPATLELETTAGEIYYVRHRYGDMAFGGHTSFEVAEPDVAREAIEETRGIPSSCGR